MKIEVEGWEKNHGPTTLVDRYVDGTCINQETHPLSHDEIKAVPFDYLDFQNQRDGKPTASEWHMVNGKAVSCGITIVSGVPQIALNGRYQITVQFSADELLRMAIEATKAWPVEYLLARMSAARTAQPKDDNG